METDDRCDYCYDISLLLTCTIDLFLSGAGGTETGRGEADAGHGGTQAADKARPAGGGTAPGASETGMQ